MGELPLVNANFALIVRHQPYIACFCLTVALDRVGKVDAHVQLHANYLRCEWLFFRLDIAIKLQY